MSLWARIVGGRGETSRPRVRRGWLGARLDARTAVAAAMPLEVYLEGQLARYSALAPVDGTPLPYRLKFRGDQVEREPSAEEDPRVRVLTDPAGVSSPGTDSSTAIELRAMAATASAWRDQVARELAAAQEDVDRHAAGLVEIRERIAEHEEEAREAVATGAAHVAATAARRPESRDRPALPDPTGELVAGALVVAALLAEAYQAMGPFSDALGLDLSGGLAAAWRRWPDGVAMAAGFSLAAVLTACLLVHGAVRSLRRTLAPERTRRQQWVSLGAALFCAVGYGVLGYALAALRHAGAAATVALSRETANAAGTPPAGEPPAWVFVVVTLLVPVGVELALQWIGRCRRHWHKVAEAQRAWDRAQNHRQERSERDAALGADLARARADLEARTEQARASVRRLEEATRAADQRLREEIAHGRMEARRWLQETEAALAIDRLHFCREAARQLRPELVTDRATAATVRALVAPRPDADAAEDSGVHRRARGG